MPFLGLSYSPPTPIEALVQKDRIDIARLAADATPWKSLMRGLGSFYDELSGLGDLGAPPVQGTRAWWQWYATSYLPQFYSPTQIQQYVVASPYYQQFGSPFGYQYTYPQTYQYGQQYQYPYQYQYNNPYSYNQYPYNYNQYQPQYPQYYGNQGPSDCAARGGYWDYGQNVCGGASTIQYNPSTQPPNVIGMPIWAAVAALNGAGFNVWLLNQDSVSQGVPPGYSQNRVDISVTNGVVTASAVG